MQVPASTKCDFCGGDVSRESARLYFPLNAEQRAAFVHERGARPGVVFDLFDAMGIVPNAVTLDFCPDCLDGLVPMIGETVAKRVAEQIESRRERAATVTRVED